MLKIKKKEKIDDSGENRPKKRINEYILELEQQNAEYLTGWKRSRADFENYKKRQEDWAEELKSYANENLISQIIPLIDNLILAVNHLPETEENKNWRLGLDQIVKQAEGILIANQVEFIEVEPGSDFNPEEQESLSKNNEENEASSKNQKSKLTVEKVLKRGYRMGEKIIQPALVVLK